MYAQANVLIRKFGMCSSSVKVALFKSFCTPLYTAHLWRRYKSSSIQKLHVAYNDGMRLLLKVPRWSRASHHFVHVDVPSCPTVLRNLMDSSMLRLTVSSTMTDCTMSAVRFTSTLWNHCHVTYVIYM